MAVEPRLLLGAGYLTEIRVTLTVLKLMKVLTFHEAVFRWESLQHSTHAVFMINDAQKMLLDFFINQLLCQWYVGFSVRKCRV